MREEIRPVLARVPGMDAINLEKYQEILVERFSNVLIADQLMRVAQDTSNKFSIQVCMGIMTCIFYCHCCRESRCCKQAF